MGALPERHEFEAVVRSNECCARRGAGHGLGDCRLYGTGTGFLGRSSVDDGADSGRGADARPRGARNGAESPASSGFLAARAAERAGRCV